MMIKVSQQPLPSQVCDEEAEVFLLPSLKEIIVEIEIEAHKKIGEVQRVFNTAFPYLKVEFLPVSRLNRPSTKFVLPETKIDEVVKNVRHCIVKFPSNITVGEFENMFSNRVGLPVKILRKSGNMWIETTMTRRWTLDRQNEHGRALSA